MKPETIDLDLKFAEETIKEYEMDWSEMTSAQKAAMNNEWGSIFRQFEKYLMKYYNEGKLSEDQTAIFEKVRKIFIEENEELKSNQLFNPFE